MPPPDDIGGYLRATSFARILADAIADLAEHGYSSAERIETWLALLRAAAERELGGEEAIDTKMRAAMGAIYQRLVERGRVVQYVPGVSRYTFAMVQPQLRAELDRRILAAADLIKLHRREAIEKTLQRFRGWSTSIPPGGEGMIDKREVRANVSKSVKQFAFERRRVAIDQSAKLVANISEITAIANGALGGIWNSHFRQIGYNYREDHKELDGHLFVVRGNWALEQGFMKLAGHRYIDEIERPASKPFCRCWYTWVTSLRRLPDAMLTRDGQEWLRQADMRRSAA